MIGEIDEERMIAMDELNINKNLDDVDPNVTLEETIPEDSATDQELDETDEPEDDL